MSHRNLLTGKRILIVDDESDVLQLLEDLLSFCDITKASTFDEAREFLETRYYDIAILDIMGVDGYKLLEIARKKEMIVVMLTAHALSPEDIVKSYQEGAATYVPKEKIGAIDVFLTDLLEAKAEGKHFWWRWFDRFGTYMQKKFGPDWQEKDREFWKRFGHWE